jgi:hypothetical protein
MSAEKQRDHALSVLDMNLKKLSILYKECYLSIGRGALLVYADDVINNHVPSKEDYRGKDQILDIFDSPPSSTQLQSMIEKYNNNKEGILVLITSDSNATFFITVKLI